MASCPFGHWPLIGIYIVCFEGIVVLRGGDTFASDAAWINCPLSVGVKRADGIEEMVKATLLDS